ncbi:hypothetical protein PP175_07100 [Aneurinibacillus sp. Ricciae_BoGa-3]|uniref:hypothetical protein n=1 Tax=Aneurinibacillus sp. Ricciae_BoGa-3 TaxID=3022697 RepID=UPI002340C750|nr:hypothetical protein [Aneurinibacillus sp. Ricciae_BoGa-3]WCK55702.1 hypothetical protein PP175_07100 [Aneurinibacillus sp. Ricciae_BoGa-3]
MIKISKDLVPNGGARALRIVLHHFMVGGPVVGFFVNLNFGSVYAAICAMLLREQKNEPAGSLPALQTGNKEEAVEG